MIRHQQVNFTPELDAEIVRLRTVDGLTWVEIERALSLPRGLVIERGRFLQLRGRNFARRAGAVVTPTFDTVRLREGSAPLRAGHPLTWDVLVTGTLLDGLPYPD